MEQLKGSLGAIPLPAVMQLLLELGSTGRLRIRQGTWLGEIALHRGQVVAAQLGTEHGRAALEGIVLALTDAEFIFVNEPVEYAGEALLARDELAGYLAGLVVEREQLKFLTGVLARVARLEEGAHVESETARVTIEAVALLLIPSLVHGHTLGQIAQRRGLARTLREVAMLQSAGLVRLEAAASVAVLAAHSAPQEVLPPWPISPRASVQQVRSPQPAAASQLLPAVAQQHGQTSSWPAPVSTLFTHDKPQLPLTPQQVSADATPAHASAAAPENPRLSPPIHETVEPMEVQGGSTSTSAGRSRGGWRKALLDLFIAEAPQTRSPHTPD